MYTIYADGKLLHDPRLFHEGCGVLSPKLTVELNKAGSLQFTLPPNNIWAKSMDDELDNTHDMYKLKSIITAYQNGVEIFRGRVLHDEKDFYKQRKVYCEGQLAFLLDSTQRPYTFTGTVKELFTRLITNHNSHVGSDKQFKVGNVMIADNDDIYCENYNYPTTFDEITEQILSVFGGNLVIRSLGNTRYIDLIADHRKVRTVIG